MDATELCKCYLHELYVFLYLFVTHVFVSCLVLMICCTARRHRLQQFVSVRVFLTTVLRFGGRSVCGCYFGLTGVARVLFCCSCETDPSRPLSGTSGSIFIELHTCV